MSIALTPEEIQLIEVAVRLACAVQYWENSATNAQMNRRLKGGIDKELVRIT
jgi:hypothetical protein